MCPKKCTLMHHVANKLARIGLAIIDRPLLIPSQINRVLGIK